MIWKLLIDFGLVILIWMTQLVVYPSFTYFQISDLMNWHSRYTTAISIIVMPLMLGQLFLHSYLLYTQFSILSLIAFACVFIAWIITFFYAVPLHNQLGSGHEVHACARRLVQINVPRTALWTIAFLITLWQVIKMQL